MGVRERLRDNKPMAAALAAVAVGLFLVGVFALFEPSSALSLVVPLAIASYLLFVLRLVGEPDRASVESLAAALSCVALLLAGYWYVVERRGMPKLNIEPRIQTWSVGEGRALARVELLLHNVGATDILLVPDDKVLLEIGQVLPLAGGHARMMDEAYQPVVPGGEPLTIMKTDKFPLRATLNQGFDLRDDDWDLRNDQFELKIEPGETDRRYFKAIIPCEDGLISSVRVEVPKKLNWFQRAIENDKTPHVWRSQAISDEIEVC